MRKFLNQSDWYFFLVIQLFFLMASVTFAASSPNPNDTQRKCDPDGSYECWNRCPWVFDECAKDCGGGAACWHKCPWVFDECAKTCGRNGAPNLAVFQHYQYESQQILRSKNPVK